MVKPAILSEATIWQILESVSDPEIPVLTIADLGVIREVHIDSAQRVEVVITPTYSGCPAMREIEIAIKAALQNEGIDQVSVRTVLRPAWTTAWMSEAGKEKLRAYGIAPPEQDTEDKSVLLGRSHNIQCPICGSRNTEMISQFGSTACKSLYKCLDCLEPFDYFKCH